MRGAATACAILFCLSAPAHALVAVIGSGLAHDCFVMAKAGTDAKSAIATCTMALQEEALDVRARAGTHVNRGVMEMALGRTDEAMADYDRALTLNPGLGDGYVDRGAALIKLKRYDEAMTDINRGISLGQTYEQIGYYNRGVAEFYLGKAADSYHDFKKALEIAPDFTLASEQLKNFVVTRVPAGQGRTP
jgi:tetratricopeptide (TPR) repeat protein